MKNGKKQKWDQKLPKTQRTKQRRKKMKKDLHRDKQTKK